MARVLVASNDQLALNPHEAAVGKPYPPLGALVIAANLRRAGHEVAVHDPMFEPAGRGLAALGEAMDAHRPEIVVIAADDHAVHQKMCLGVLREAALAMIRAARARGAGVVVAGPDASTWPDAYGDATAVVVGDAAAVLVDWVAGKDGLVGVHGAHGAGGRVPLIEDLDSLPDPAWDAIRLENYKSWWIRRHGRWELNVWTARGCPYRCNWCAKPTWGRSYHVRSAARVAAEIARLRREHGVDRIWFTDDIFALRPSWLRALRAALAEPVPYRCLSRADLMKDPAYTADLAATGCDEVWMGAESGSDRVLSAMDKDGTVAEVEAATALLRQHGIRACFFLQLGYPGETLDDVRATLAMVRRLRPDEIGVSVSYPHPGTAFYERVSASLKDRSWAVSMDNKPLFEAPYAEPFYAAAKEVLRSQHSAGKAGEAVRAFLRRPDARTARRVLGAAFHAARLPIVERRMEALAVPNPRAVVIGG